MDDLENLIHSAGRGSETEVQAIVFSHPELVNSKDATGATALHYAAFGGHRRVVELLVEHGADINARDDRYGATPAGWAIEYLRELGGFLGIELADAAFAIERGDVEWTARFLKRFPRLRDAADTQGRKLKDLAQQCGHPGIARLFA